MSHLGWTDCACQRLNPAGWKKKHQFGKSAPFLPEGELTVCKVTQSLEGLYSVKYAEMDKAVPMACFEHTVWLKRGVEKVHLEQ